MILIVDDSEDIAAALQRLLRYAGHPAVCVNSGQAALELMRLRKPWLLVLDIHMPEMDGLQVLREVRADPALRDLPVVIYSADTNVQTIDEAKRLGANQCFSKSMSDFDCLIDCIAKLAAKPPE